MISQKFSKKIREIFRTTEDMGNRIDFPAIAQCLIPRRIADTLRLTAPTGKPVGF